MMPPFEVNCVILFAVSLSQLAHLGMLSFHLIVTFVGLIFLNYLVVLSSLSDQQLLAQLKILCSQQVLLLSLKILIVIILINLIKTHPELLAKKYLSIKFIRTYFTL